MPEIVTEKKIIHILAVGDILHEFELSTKGITYKLQEEEEEEEEEEKPLFKGYEEIVSDFMEKKKKTNLERRR
ncbi:hypothetical protein F2Q70_00012885 [Brassica cretica]|uniref:Uncharacterized protein n=1 Tax=Brassica cretica TaxID=69181 RepID=A0A8S9M8W9_BRACR|nr:hypothetical protein F2Q70_00012885 [Brassica cretica]